MRKYTLQRTLLALSVAACLVPAYAQSQSAGSGSSSSSTGSSSMTSPSTSGPSSMRDSHSGSSATGSTMGKTSPSTGSDTSSHSGTMTTPGMSSSTSTSPSGSDASGAMAKDQGVTETDRTLNNQIRTALKADSSLRDASHTVSLSGDNGVVTLNGTVATEKEKKDIESRIERMTGVKEVENNLQIAPRTSSATNSSGSAMTSPSALGTSETMTTDQALTESDRNLNTQIRSALKADSSLRDLNSGVSIRTDDGVVALNGSVATAQEKADLESRIKRMAGVKEVENNLQITPQTSSASPSSTTTAR